METAKSIPQKAVAALVELYSFRVQSERERGVAPTAPALATLDARGLPPPAAELALMLFGYTADTHDEVVRVCVDVFRQLVVLGPGTVLHSQGAEKGLTEAEVAMLLACMPGLKEYWSGVEEARGKTVSAITRDCIELFRDLEEAKVLHQLLLTGIRSFYRVALLKKGATFPQRMQGVQEWLQLMDEVCHLLLRSNAPQPVVATASSLKERTASLWWRVVQLYERFEDEEGRTANDAVDDLREGWLEMLERKLSESCAVHVKKDADPDSGDTPTETEHKPEGDETEVETEDQESVDDDDPQGEDSEVGHWGQERYVKLYKMAQMDRWLREHQTPIVSYIMGNIQDIAGGVA